MIVKVKKNKGHPSYRGKVKNFNAPGNSSSSKQIIIAIKLDATIYMVDGHSVNTVFIENLGT